MDKEKTLYVVIGHPFNVDDDSTICAICDDLKIVEGFAKVVKCSPLFLHVSVSEYTLNELVTL